MSLEMKKVYVATATDRTGKTGPYIYGIFDDDQLAHEHFQKYGDKDCTIQVRSEQYIYRVK